MSEYKKEKGDIIMSTVYFFDGLPPNQIDLKDCGFPLHKVIENTFSGLYGHIGKQAGFLATKDYAEHNHLNYTIIDFHVKFCEPIQTAPVKLEELIKKSVISLQRLSKSELNKICYNYLDINIEDKKAYLQAIRHPEILSKLIENKEFSELKLLIYPAITKLSEKPITIGSIPNKHLGLITSAVCRLHPNIKINLPTDEDVEI